VQLYQFQRQKRMQKYDFAQKKKGWKEASGVNEASINDISTSSMGNYVIDRIPARFRNS